MAAEAQRQLAPFENEAEANAVLHAVGDERAFREFQGRVAETLKSRAIRVVVRKRHLSQAFAFVATPGKAAKVDFLYADGAARGRSLWTSLWRSIKVQMPEAGRET